MPDQTVQFNQLGWGGVGGSALTADGQESPNVESAVSLLDIKMTMLGSKMYIYATNREGCVARCVPKLPIQVSSSLRLSRLEFPRTMLCRFNPRRNDLDQEHSVKASSSPKATRFSIYSISHFKYGMRNSSKALTFNNTRHTKTRLLKSIYRVICSGLRGNTWTRSFTIVEPN